MYNVYFFTVSSGTMDVGLIVAASTDMETARSMVEEKFDLHFVEIEGREVEELNSETETVLDGQWNGGAMAM